MSRQFHVALSFAGEDRDYVDSVAKALQAEGADVFYDKFEEADLWGKDLYGYLSDIYQNRADFTVIFISDAYSKKLWTNHERKSAQARAFTESQEYILPAFFDEAVEVPGLLKTTGYIALAGRSPVDVAALIVQKLRRAGVRLKQPFAYSDEVKADADFPLVKGNKIAELIRAMKTCNWYKQNPAVVDLLGLEWDTVSADEAFVLGRNLYQCACGGEKRALGFLDRLRHELAALPPDRAIDLLNGMFFEVYFDSAGEFRGGQIKGPCLGKLLTIQTANKYEASILFIQRALGPYRDELPFVPSTAPQDVVVHLRVERSPRPMIRSLTLNGRDLLQKDKASDSPGGRVWRLSNRGFSLMELKSELAEMWSILPALLTIVTDEPLDPRLDLRLPDDASIRWPVRP